MASETITTLCAAGCGRAGAGQLGLCAGCRLATYRQTKYKFTPMLDEQLRAAYREPSRIKLSAALTTLQKAMRCPRHILSNRAQTLGLSAIVIKPWTDAEKEFLANNATSMSLYKLAKLMHRSESAIKQYAARAGVVTRCDEGYSGRELCQLMGVSQGQVQAWLRRGLLDREPEIADRITQESVRRLLAYHMEEYSLRRVEEWWMKTLVREELASHKRGPKSVSISDAGHHAERRISA